MARTPPKGVVMHLTEEQVVTDPANWKEPPATGSSGGKPASCDLANTCRRKKTLTAGPDGNCTR